VQSSKISIVFQLKYLFLAASCQLVWPGGFLLNFPAGNLLISIEKNLKDYILWRLRKR
jgi:hypothetical protein